MLLTKFLTATAALSLVAALSAPVSTTLLAANDYGTMGKAKKAGSTARANDYGTMGKATKPPSTLAANDYGTMRKAGAPDYGTMRKG